MTDPRARCGSAGTLKMRILIVEDNADAAATMAMLLRLKGHAAETCGTAARALEHVAELRPDAAIVDLGLPDMSGVEFVRLARRLPGAEATRFFALTGRQPSDAQDADVFDHFFVKPVDFDQLLRVLVDTPS